MSMFVLHIGVEKTGTTFLQRSVFPRWQGMEYVASGSIADVVKVGTSGTVLISDESLWVRCAHRYRGEAFWRAYGSPDLIEASIAGLHRLVPDARILLSFRRHDSWLLSLYRQYLHEGGIRRFPEFFDVNGQGLIPPAHVNFAKLIDVVAEVFQRAPITFLHEDLRDSPKELLAAIADELGVPPPASTNERGDDYGHNRGVGRYQATILRALNLLSRTDYNPSGLLPLHGLTMRRLRLDPRRVSQDWLMRALPVRPIRLPDEVQHSIRVQFDADWRDVEARALHPRSAAE